MEDLLERVVKDSTNGTRLKTVHEASKDTLGEWHSKFLRMHLRCRTMLLDGWTKDEREYFFKCWTPVLSHIKILFALFIQNF